MVFKSLDENASVMSEVRLLQANKKATLDQRHAEERLWMHSVLNFEANSQQKSALGALQRAKN